MKKMALLHPLLSIAGLLLLPIHFATVALAQRTSPVRSEGIINTTWQIYFKGSARDSWNEGEKLTFLSGGKLKVGGQLYPQTSWQLRGRKLSFSYNDNAGMLGEGEVTIQGNRADGGGQLGMQGTPFIIRLVMLASAPQPTGKPASLRDGVILRDSKPAE